MKRKTKRNTKIKEKTKMRCPLCGGKCVQCNGNGGFEACVNMVFGRRSMPNGSVSIDKAEMSETCPLCEII